MVLMLMNLLKSSQNWLTSIHDGWLSLNRQMKKRKGNDSSDLIDSKFVDFLDPSGALGRLYSLTVMFLAT